MSTIPDYKTLVTLLRVHDALYEDNKRAKGNRAENIIRLVKAMSGIQIQICKAIPKPARRDRLHDGNGYKSNLSEAVGCLIVTYFGNSAGAAPAIARILQLKDAP